MSPNEQIRELIAEEKKTQEILKQVLASGTLDQLTEDIEAKLPDWSNKEKGGWSFLTVDDWDYEDTNEACNNRITYHLAEAYDHIAILKWWLHYMDNLYKGRIAEWEKIRVHYGRKDSKAWLNYYKNPRCLEFFESYERDHHIKNSIYQDYKQALAKKKKK